MNNAWKETQVKYKKGYQSALIKFIKKTKDTSVVNHGGYFPHRVHSITNTFGTAPMHSDQVRIQSSLANLMKFNFVFVYDRFYEELNVTFRKYFNWTNGYEYLEKLGRSSGQYPKYLHQSNLPKDLIKTLEKVMASDIAVYEKMRDFNKEREKLREICRNRGGI